MPRTTGVAVLAAILLAASCAQPPVPQEYFHRLTAAPTERQGASPRLEGTLEIERFAAEGLIHDRALVYVDARHPHTLRQYRYHFWTDSPTRMLQHTTADYLRDVNLARRVVTPELRASPSYTLTGKVKRLEHVVGNSARVVVELEFGLRRESDGELVWMQGYEVEKEIDQDGVLAAVRSMNEAVEQILANLVRDVEVR